MNPRDFLAQSTATLQAKLRAAAAEMAAEDADEAKKKRYYDDPVFFALDMFGVELWDKQAEIARGIAANPAVAVKSGHKVGKSMLLAVIAWWWACTRERATVICSSSTDRQVRGIIWKEVRKLWRMAQKLGNDLPKPAELPSIGVQWEDGREIKGFTAGQPEAMAGFSGDQLLFLIDEASGVDDVLFEAIEGNLAADGARIAIFSNPTKATGKFYNAFNRERAEWKTYTIRSLDTPNARHGSEVIKGLAGRDWCEKRKRVWGEASAYYKVRVLGEFPDQGDNSVVPRALLQVAKERWEKTEGEGSVLYAAIDVARFGDDESVIAFRLGLKVYDLMAQQGLDNIEVADWFLQEVEEVRDGKCVKVRVDTTGNGGGVADSLRARDLHWLDVEDFVGSGKAVNDTKYLNARAESWFSVGEFVNAGGALPEDEEMELELGAPTYMFNKERTQVESKDSIKKRLGRSPDRADAVCMVTWKYVAAENDNDGDGQKIAVGGRRRW